MSRGIEIFGIVLMNIVVVAICYAMVLGLLWLPVGILWLIFDLITLGTFTPFWEGMTRETKIFWILLPAIVICILKTLLDIDELDSEAKRVKQEIAAKAERVKQEIAADAKRVKQESAAKAELVKQVLLGCIDLADKGLSALPLLFRNFEKYLDQAESEFSKGAIIPFWEFIEASLIEAGHISDVAQKMHTASCEYIKLSSENESFMSANPFPVDSESMKKLPDANLLSQRMDEMVYKAKCDFQFGSIFEQRKTNAILIAGFVNVGEALSQMTQRVTASISSLKNSVDRVGDSVDRVGDSVDRVGDSVDRVGDSVDRVGDSVDRVGDSVDRVGAIIASHAVASELRDGERDELLDNLDK